MSVLIEISAGELVDKIGILEIKLKKTKSPLKLKHIKEELVVLKSSWEQSSYSKIGIHDMRIALNNVNKELWEIEDKLRIKESLSNFDIEFLELARLVYIKNDKRAYLKSKINHKVGSRIIEEKIYPTY